MSNANAVRSAQSGPFVGRRKAAAITPGAITTLQTIAVDFPFAEAEVGDIVTVSFNAALVAGIIFSMAAVLVKGTVKLYFSNITAGTLTQTIITPNVGVSKSV